MIECIQSCSPEEQWDFARDLSTGCRERVFPNATASSSSTSGDEEEESQGVGSTVEVDPGTDGVGVLGVPGVGLGVGVLGAVSVALLL